jgi:hypothetical protein
VKLLAVQTCVIKEYPRRRQGTNEAEGGKKKEEKAYHSDEI